LDYCNSILAGVSSQLLQKLQVVHNAAARLVVRLQTAPAVILEGNQRVHTSAMSADPITLTPSSECQ